MAESGLSGRWGSAMRMAMMVVGLVCLAGAHAWADGSAGRTAFLAGDYRVADRELRPAADLGDAEAALYLGRMAENGLGRPVDEREAWVWYKRAADGGQAEAMVRAADFAWSGRGTVLDRRQAYALFKRAADAGNPRALGRIGEMAFWGEGRPVDAGRGMTWLRQAADGDDPEALSLLDDLAVLGRAEPVMPGSASPRDPFAQRVIEDLRAAVSGMTLGGEVTALVRPDGSVRLTLPDLAAVIGGRDCHLGTVRLVFRNPGGDGADFDLLLPSRLALGDSFLSLSGQRATGRWSFRLHGPVVLHGEAVAGRLDGLAWLTFRGLSVDRRVGGGVASERMSLADLAAGAEVAGHRLRLAAHRLSAGGEIRSASPAAATPGQWGVARMLLWLFSGEGGNSFPAVAAASGNVAGEGLDVEDNGVPLIAVGRLDSGLALADLDKPLAGAHWSYAHDGWTAGGRFSAPARVTLGVGGEGVPVAALWRFAVGAWSPEARDDLAVALAAAGSRISIDEAGASGDRWSLTATGAVLPANGVLTLAADVTVADLEELLAASSRLDPATGQLLRRVGRPATDGKGRPLTLFQVVMPPGAAPLVNGKALEDQVFP